uniref:Hypothetical chloroplast RF1 n=1 Tax=Chloroparvula japonica TaxID=1411623 RepID=A0A4D6C564_9CHLO|nr:hypothetical chloroplast RF1 [Chloroparvula japonica]QBX98159.1 hypothetical chloroplast RF1 [Chloroparvula japonica]
MDWFNTIFENTPALNAFFWFIQITLSQVVSSTVNFLQYILCFEWVTNIAAFPVVAPSLVSQLLHLPVLEATQFDFSLNASEDSFTNAFFQGLFTAAILSLPSSPARLLAIRNWVVQGVWFGSATLFGLLLVEILFISSCIFGISPFLEFIRLIYPFWFVLGIICIISQFSQLVYANGNPVQRVGINTDIEKRILIQAVFQGAFLSSFEQTNFLPYLGNFVIGPNSFVGEGFLGVINNTWYLVGLILGLIGFGLAINLLVSAIMSMRLTTPGTYRFVFFNGRLAYLRGVKFSRIFAIGLLTSVFLSLPYYSSVYLASQPVSLNPREAAFLSNEIGWLTRATQLNPVALFNTDIVPVGLWNRSLPVDRSYRKMITRNVHNWRTYGNYIDPNVGPGTVHFPSFSNFGAEILLDRTAYRSYLMNHIQEVNLRNLSDKSNGRRIASYLSPWFANWDTKFVSILRTKIGSIPISFRDENTQYNLERKLPFQSIFIGRDSDVYGAPKVGSRSKGVDVVTRMGPSSFFNKTKIAQTRSHIQTPVTRSGKAILGWNRSNFQNRKFVVDKKSTTLFINPWDRNWIQLDSIIWFPLRLIYGLCYQVGSALMRVRIFGVLTKFSPKPQQSEPIPGNKLYFEGMLPPIQQTRGVRRWLVGREARVRRAWQFLKINTVQPRMYALYASQFEKLGLLRRLFLYKAPIEITKDRVKKGIFISHEYLTELDKKGLPLSKLSRALKSAPTRSSRRATNSIKHELTDSKKNSDFYHSFKKLFYQASGRKLGQDPFSELLRSWATAKWLEHELERSLKVVRTDITGTKTELIVEYPTVTGRVPLSYKDSATQAQTALRRQIMRVKNVYKTRFINLHNQWVNRSVIRPQQEPWSASPSEEQLVWMLSRIHNQSIASVSESSYQHVQGLDPELKGKKFDDLNRATLLTPRNQINWMVGLNRLTKGDRLHYIRGLEREIKGVSPTLLRYNRYMSVNRELVKKAQKDFNSGVQPNQYAGLILNGLTLEPIHDKYNRLDFATNSRRSLQPFTINSTLKGVGSYAPSVFQPFSVEKTVFHYDSGLNRYKSLLYPRVWTLKSGSRKLASTPSSFPWLSSNFKAKTIVEGFKVDGSSLEKLKTNKLLQNVKRWAKYQELLGEREFFYRRQGRRGKRRRTKDLRVLRFGSPNPYMMQMSADFNPQVVPSPYGRRRIRSSLIPTQENWQYTTASQKSPPYTKSKKSFFSKKNARRRRKQYKKLKNTPKEGFSKDFLETAHSTRRRKKRRYRKRSKLKRGRRYQTIIGDRSGFIKVLAQDFERDEQERKLRRRLRLFEEKGIFKIINDVKAYTLLMLTSGVKLQTRDDWSSLNYRQARTQIANSRRADQDWERPRFNTSLEQVGQRPPIFTRTSRHERKMDRRLTRPSVPLAYSHGDGLALNSWIGLMRGTSTYIHGLPLVVDKVLSGQPIDHILTPKEETQLSKHRIQLTRYYDSLREYRNSPNWRRFVPGGTRSWIDNVYNHQFKGTLKTVRRLFYLTPLESQNSTGARVYKYNQLLYDREGENYNPILHEELGDVRLLEPQSPFFELTTSVAPFYVGWDNKNENIIVTNRYPSLAVPKNISNHPHVSLQDELTTTTSTRLDRKVFEWSNKNLNNLSIQTYEPTRVSRYRFFKELRQTMQFPGDLNLDSTDKSQEINNTWTNLGLNHKTGSLLAMLNQVRLRNKLAYGTLDLLGPWSHTRNRSQLNTGESNRYFIRGSLVTPISRRGQKYNQVKKLQSWFNQYRPYPFSRSNIMEGGVKKKREKKRALYSLGSMYTVSGPKVVELNSFPNLSFEYKPGGVSAQIIQTVLPRLKKGLQHYPEIINNVLPVFLVNQTRPSGSRSQWNNVMQYPNRISDLQNRQQSNRSVPFSLMWVQLLGCRYLIKDKVFSLVSRNQLLNLSEQLPILSTLEDQASKDMIFWSKSYGLKKRKMRASPVKIGDLPPQGRGVQDKGYWRLRRTRAKSGKRKFKGYTYPF